MDRRIILAVALLTLVAPVALAQPEGTLEISGLAGQTWSDGVSGSGSYNGYSYTQIEPKDAFSWGFTAGYMGPYGTELEFLYDRQATDLDMTSLTGKKTIGSMSIDNYHGLIVYNLIQRDGPAIPYVFGGLGATSYGDVAFTSTSGTRMSISGPTKFSTTWGAGLKIYPQDKPYGLKLQFRWTPTYIKTDNNGGYWCDPYWGCTSTGSAQYSNQFELAAGVTFRFHTRG